MTNAPYVVDLDAVDASQLGMVGGKGANLGELGRIDGVRVPRGFCVTTAAFRRFVAAANVDVGALAAAELRAVLERTPVPDDVADAVTQAYARLGAETACAVRSSATAEDLPTASFAGQQDTFLEVVGIGSILAHVRRCWASLFTERALACRRRNAIDERAVAMGVVVQEMVPAEVSGVLFTAHPLTGHRKVTSIEAVRGLGEALVSGRAQADAWEVRADCILTKNAPQATLDDAQVVRLAELGRRIEAHFGAPQDIEWCRVGNDFAIVQSRPITTLFPIPLVDDRANHVWVSVGHQQMMTDAIRPLGLSFWQLTTPRPMAEAGGRLFVDVTRALASPASRANLLDALGKSDVLLRDALQTLLERGDFVPTVADEGPAWTAPGTAPAAPLPTDPALPAELVARSEASIAKLGRAIAQKTGAELFDFILADLQELRKTTFDPRGMEIVMAAIQSTWWLNEKLEAWLGEKNAADVLTQSVPNNVTSEMGLALLDVADVVRRHPEVVAFLERTEDDDFLAALPALSGGAEAQAALSGWLAKYGARCSGEIDLTRPRWSQRPRTLLPLLLGNVKSFAPGEGARRFEEGRAAAARKEAEVLARLRELPDGEAKAAEVKHAIDRVRTFMGYREYPKFAMIRRYLAYKQALLREAARLVEEGVLLEQDDVYFLRFEELREAVATRRADRALIAQRKEAHRSYEGLVPPRVLTSDGEALHGAYRRTDAPAGALLGLPVSAGTVEGRARVVSELADARFEAGDVLVTRFTDPSWTPAFVAIAGLVTEVGGMMTHGAVIAREYGLPAVVGVENATGRIRDGQRIRVHGTEGWVELVG
jgi:pyruvate,water dikinase